MDKYIALHEVRCSGGIIPTGAVLPTLKQDEVNYLVKARAISKVLTQEPIAKTIEPTPELPVVDPEPDKKQKSKNGGK